MAFESSGAKDPLAYEDANGYGVGPDISGFATLAGNQRLAILIYNHHDDWDMATAHKIALDIAHLPLGAEALTLRHYRIDREHSNAHAEWVRQGRPMYPAPGQYAAIKAREGLELLEPPRTVSAPRGGLQLAFSLPVHGISLLLLEPVPATP